jgi:hypothetical protein
MPRRLTAGKHPVMAYFALGGQRLENTSYMAGLTGDIIVLAFQRKTSGDMIERGKIFDGCGVCFISYVGQ